jgi:riboflavin synthase
MFTGLVQKTGKLLGREISGGSGQLSLQAESWNSPLVQGESISVQGVCLTLLEFGGSVLRFDVLRETFERSSIGQKRIGQRLNLERALKMGDALGGHIVTGHVDGVGHVKSLKRVGRDWSVEIECDEALLTDMVPKGSIACDGVSLTIVDLKESSFVVHVIPHTWDVTSFSELTSGAMVNVETDVLGKHVRRTVERGTQQGGVTWESLRNAGFMP